MKKIRLEDLYTRLNIPSEVMVKFNEFNIDIKMINDLFYGDEDGFFEFIEENYKDKYLEILYIYLNLAVTLYDMYLEKNICLDIYYDTIDDIRIWANNCVKETGIYGLKEIYWINEHLRMRIFKLGRLQFQKRDASEFIDLLKTNNLDKFVKRDYFYFVHIPEGEKLSYDLVLDSYKKASVFFKDEMIFACESWMLSDRLDLIFNENSNILRFRQDYILLEQRREENHIKRYLTSESPLLKKVESLEKSGIMIGEGFGICLKFIKEGGHYNG